MEVHKKSLDKTINPFVIDDRTTVKLKHSHAKLRIHIKCVD